MKNIQFFDFIIFLPLQKGDVLRQQAKGQRDFYEKDEEKNPPRPPFTKGEERWLANGING